MISCVLMYFVTASIFNETSAAFITRAQIYSSFFSYMYVTFQLLDCHSTLGGTNAQKTHKQRKKPKNTSCN